MCARDLYRLVDGFRGTAAAQLEEYRLLERLLREQCVVGNKRDGRPGEGDDDAGVRGGAHHPQGPEGGAVRFPAIAPPTRRPPTAGTKARGTRYRWRRPAMRRTPPS